MRSWLEQLQQDGFCKFEGVLTGGDFDLIERRLASADIRDASIGRRDGTVYAIRNLLQLIPELKEWPRQLSISTHLHAAIGRCRAVRAILFDKVPGANWRVSWHQDISVPVVKRIDVAGFDAWSTKAGVLHPNAPASVLENMLALRFHLDDCGLENAPLQVLPGSHKRGRVSAEQVAQIAATTEPVACIA